MIKQTQATYWTTKSKVVYSPCILEQQTLLYCGNEETVCTYRLQTCCKRSCRFHCGGGWWHIGYSHWFYRETSTRQTSKQNVHIKTLLTITALLEMWKAYNYKLHCAVDLRFTHILIGWVWWHWWILMGAIKCIKVNIESRGVHANGSSFRANNGNENGNWNSIFYRWKIKFPPVVWTACCFCTVTCSDKRWTVNSDRQW